tara:strand:+ start:2375 stop:4660 length:2286 start_codon:yes stop_codon:yes gene_type:complete
MKLKVVNKETKNQLAKLLASENLTVEHKKVSTASFDTKNRVLTLPIWKDTSSDLYDLLIGHEVGHALFTPKTYGDTVKENCMGKRKKFPRGYLNIVEDARIEKMVKNKFPGLKFNFYKGYTELKEKDFFKLASTNIEKLKLIDKINLYCKLGSLINLPFTEEETKFVKMVENVKSFDDVIATSKKIFKYTKDHQKDEEPDTDLMDELKNDMFGDGDDFEIEDSDSEMDKEGENGEAGECGNDEFDEFDNFDPDEPITQENFDESLKKLLEDKDSQERVYVTIPDVKLENIIVPASFMEAAFDGWFSQPYKDSSGYTLSYKNKANHKVESDALYLKLKRNSTSIVNHMVKEFQMKKKADEYKRIRTAKTGVVDTQKLFSYRYNEDIFKQLSVTPDAQNHGLVMFLDWSGSMQDNIAGTFDQLLNLVWFCKKVNMPFRVYIFSDHSCELFNNFETHDKANYKLNDIHIPSYLKLIDVCNSEMNAKKLEKILKYYYFVAKSFDYSISGIERPKWMELNGTPLNAAILCAGKVINNFKKHYKLQFVNTVFLSDGESHGIRQYISNDHLNDEKDIERIKERDLYKYENKEEIIESLKTHDPKIFEQYGLSFSSYGCSGHYHKDVRLKGFGGRVDDRGIGQTTTLLKALKEITNTNIVCFFILPDRDRRFWHSRLIHDLFPHNLYNWEAKQAQRKGFKKLGYLSVKDTCGYDEFYLIKGGRSMKIEEEELEIDSSKSATAIKNMFMKHTKGTKEKRVILSKFIEIIA